MMSPKPQLFLLVLFFLTITQQTHSTPLSSFQSILSISHSLASRVANLRSTRGDFSGAARARNFARTIEPGLNLGFFRFALNLSWDYVKTYYSWWSGGTGNVSVFGTLAGVMNDLNELLKGFGEFGKLRSNAERVSWVGRNYENVLRVSKSLLERVLAVCRESGPLREVVEALEREILDGELLKDCLELGADDLKGLIRAFKDIASQYGSASSRTEL